MTLLKEREQEIATFPNSILLAENLEKKTYFFLSFETLVQFWFLVLCLSAEVGKPESNLSAIGGERVHDLLRHWRSPWTPVQSGMGWHPTGSHSHQPGSVPKSFCRLSR